MGGRCYVTRDGDGKAAEGTNSSSSLATSQKKSHSMQSLNFLAKVP